MTTAIKRPRGRPRVYFPGDRFGHWTITEDARYYPHRNGRGYVKVRCDCGTERMVLLPNLTSGSVISCGCARSESQQARRNRERKEQAQCQD